jgi:hypothetical protein
MKNAGFGSDMSRLKQEEEAKQYRDMLLKADRERYMNFSRFLTRKY